MAVLTPQSTAITGLETTFVAAAGGGDSFLADDRTFLWVINGDATPKTVTIDSKARASTGLAQANQDVVVTNGEARLIGPFTSAWVDAETRTANVTYSAVTSVTVAVVRLP